MIPTMYVMGNIDLMTRFLNAMNVTYVPMIATVTTTILHPLWLYLFVDFRIPGVALASAVTMSMQLIIVLHYAHWRLPHLKDAMIVPDKDDMVRGWG